MPLPGYEVGVVDQQQSRTADASTSTSFLVGLAPFGPTDQPILSRNRRKLEEAFGAEVAWSGLHVRFDFLKRELAGPVYVQRLVGPNALAATITLKGAGNVNAVTFTANSVGGWANGATGGLSLAVVDAGSSKVRLVLRSNGAIVATSADAATVDALDGWVTPYGTAHKVGSILPSVAAAANLAGGTDDRANITPLDWAEAFASIPPELGPGQIIPAGSTDPVVQAAALDHAAQRNRYAFIDAPVGTVDDIVTQALTLRAAGDGRHGSLVTPPLVAPNGVGASTIPGSLLVAATSARTDVSDGPGQPGAGLFGEAKYALDVTVRYTDDERRRLNDAGVIVIQLINGKPRVYGNRSLADPITEPGNEIMSGSRVIMALRHDLGQILEQYVLRRIDAEGRLLAQLADDLAGVCERYRKRDDLYGATPEEAYSVDTGPDVNDPDELDEGVISAAVALRISPVGERVVLTITKVRATDQIAA